MICRFSPPACLHIVLDHAYRGADGRYVTTRPHAYTCDGDGAPMMAIVVPRGFRTDFASFPRVLWWLFEREGPWARAALFHDYCYRRQHVGKFAADSLFRVMLEADGVGPWTQWLFWQALRLFGKRAWMRNRARLRASGGKLSLAKDLALLTAEGA